jgi:hypothetical protein
LSLWKAALAAIVAGATLAPLAHAQDSDERSPWSARVTLDLPAAQLGVSDQAPRATLARAGARRAAAQLGVGRAELGELRTVPSRRGDAAGITQLRQTVGGLRVLWSQLDVLTADGKVAAVTGTIVPLKKAKLTGAARVSPSRAVAIARKRIAGRDTAGAAQLVAYAGDPDRPRAPRRAYVVAVDPVRERSGEDSPSAKCVVVDARSGRVIAVWDGTVAPAPERGRAVARSAQASTVLAQYEDGKGRTSEVLGNDVWDLHTPGEPFSTYDNGAFFKKIGNPTKLDGILPGPPTWRMRAPIDGTTNVARFFCRQSPMFWCGRNGGRPGTLGPGYRRWFFTVNWTGTSQFLSSQERVYLGRGYSSFDEAVHAHEIGHVIDFFSRDDFQSTVEGSEVKEAIAEMFSFVYYKYRAAKEPGTCSVEQFLRGDVTCALRDENGNTANVPHQYSGYNCSTPDEHVNGYILGRAFLTIVETIGFDDATRLLREVPRLLPAKRTFGAVHQAFEDATTFNGLGQHKQVVHDAFVAQGVTTAKRRTSTCPNAAP